MISVSSCPARPTNGSALQILVAPRALADEHQVGVRIADAEDDVGAAAAQLAALAVADLGAQRVERAGLAHARGDEQIARRGGDLGGRRRTSWRRRGRGRWRRRMRRSATPRAMRRGGRGAPRETRRYPSTADTRRRRGSRRAAAAEWHDRRVGAGSPFVLMVWSVGIVWRGPPPTRHGRGGPARTWCTGSQHAAAPYRALCGCWTLRPLNECGLSRLGLGGHRARRGDVPPWLLHFA